MRRELAAEQDFNSWLGIGTTGAFAQPNPAKKKAAESSGGSAPMPSPLQGVEANTRAILAKDVEINQIRLVHNHVQNLAKHAAFQKLADDLKTMSDFFSGLQTELHQIEHQLRQLYNQHMSEL
jgi:hypothetical protein